LNRSTFTREESTIFLPSLRGVVATKQFTPFASPLLDCFAALAMTNHSLSRFENSCGVRLMSFRGLRCSRLRCDASAIADHDQAIRLDPKQAYSYRNRGAAKQVIPVTDGNIRSEKSPRTGRIYTRRLVG